MKRKIFPNYSMIKELRAQRGWDQDWIAQAAGISKRTYQRIESGEGCLIETLKSIAAVFDVRFTTLLQATGDQTDYKPKWSRLLSNISYNLLVKPAVYTIVLLSLMVFLIGGSYVLETTEFIDFGAWQSKPITEEKEREIQRIIKESNISQLAKGAPPIFAENINLRSPLTPVELSRSIIRISLFFGAFLYILIMSINLISLKSRDIELLISIPIRKRMNQLSNCYQKQI